MVFTLSCPAIPSGMGHFEIPCPGHVEPLPHERLVGTSPLRDLLLCVLIKPGWSSTGPFPQAEGKPHPNTNRGYKYRRWQSGDLMCCLDYCPTKFFKQFRTGSGQDLSARSSRKRQFKKQNKTENLSLLILPRTTQDYFRLETHMLSLQRCIWVHFANPHHCMSGITDLWLKIVWGQQHQLFGAKLRTRWKTWQQHSRTFLAQGHRLKGKSSGCICWASWIDRLTSHEGLEGWWSSHIIGCLLSTGQSARNGGCNGRRHGSLEKAYSWGIFKKGRQNKTKTVLLHFTDFSLKLSSAPTLTKEDIEIVRAEIQARSWPGYDSLGGSEKEKSRKRPQGHICQFIQISCT